jgi:hypothetical protein
MTDAEAAYKIEFDKEEALINVEFTMETTYINDMQELEIFEDEINFIENEYIEIFAEEEAARTFVEVVEVEEKEI